MNVLYSVILGMGILFPTQLFAQYPAPTNELDKKVIQFLREQSGQWRDMNISVADGRILYDLVLNGKYKQALEIGTSTGHSTIWIAWALSKTGGKLTTIEIDKKRYVEAQANFKKAGVSELIDAKMAAVPRMAPGLVIVRK